MHNRHRKGLFSFHLKNSFHQPPYQQILSSSIVSVSKIPHRSGPTFVIQANAVLKDHKSCGKICFIHPPLNTELSPLWHADSLGILWRVRFSEEACCCWTCSYDPHVFGHRIIWNKLSGDSVVSLWLSQLYLPQSSWHRYLQQCGLNVWTSTQK